MRNNLKEVSRPLELQVLEPEKNRLTPQLNQNSNQNSKGSFPINKSWNLSPLVTGWQAL
ncbi:hypothetical protein Patl1_26905 [Pistacia atlantica]|uniref:Uncharacterized protein n=1 Tax=Pistacia atlantica TaxID=434234 RepID=A0ACC1B436_9ROSI|nr:hypothetical protein Patl1_26905 [Pistacia atlantica]